MKSITYIWVLLACLTFTSCYEDDSITPDEFGGSGRFEFPQGDNSWDEEIAEIYNTYGIRLIYKDIKDEDFDRNWTGGSGGGGGVGFMSYHLSETTNPDMIRFYVTFIKEHILQFTSPQIRDRVFPMYWYLAYNFYLLHDYSAFGGPKMYTAQTNHGDINLMDFWITCFWGQNANAGADPLQTWMSPVSGNKATYDTHRFTILRIIMTTAIERGNIVVSDEFSTGLDFTTQLVTGETAANQQDPNYYLKRGFPGSVTILDGVLAFQKTTAPRPISPNNLFSGYLQIMMAFNAAQREEMFPAATYPLLKQKFDYVGNYMKQRYDIDLEAIANGPANWDITPYPELPPPIYPE